MEYAHFVEKHNRNAAALAFTDFRAEAAEEGFDVLPGDVRAGRVREDSFQCSLMRSLHGWMVPPNSTDRNGFVF